MSPPPEGACAPQAVAVLQSALPHLNTTAGLVTAATAMAVHGVPGTEPGAVHAGLAELAMAIGRRARSRSAEAVVAHAHEVLFGELGFCGERDDYYAPDNSLLPRILARRRGLPITLTLVYKAVLEQLDVPVAGIGAPGHFLAQVVVEGRPALIDPFHRGVQLSEAEACERVAALLGRPVLPGDNLLAPIGHAAWLRRMLRNLQEAYRRGGAERDRHAMLELELQLDLHLRQG